ncbi:MAG: hypothetical protein A3C93_03555 [Candidatus Lloydbacteria bacterium RIFCSPHIGHO2_02_FULL_54_17]|uniref:D-alanyl-D-alanine carboxypeptidase-like core domain-containing protein n=1 Tax=Candidatus Lloydbacteria bacterium RIFCSPHIGHO2_02_FULL_54_17 TaxID=1798664 RepID=A0A1G2DC60_9BACT|nr:MAG: hypothetical protein A2762_03695 [Candidatus Lloydbacteria bacterium RIFCSPHIGHO2_01_FULL_54_11]OGZ11215.1 MAG: hypothetical protein A3C93_03555 [Candidatus Lloydbacteria bacterium RIFCSPHIGHO2_02_FULL_54_17]OGZ13878.1 MAG: hypothetical protein A2948_02370 [Candidatus Lloydbacteria bacterium RIFCSPLOWO2_01_FULL_54_18]OGZ16552.1 MAG: hypothetical protein A3H76_01185 [Candidatus Lloydbacteria bacterium RIFCSPLOWO2_02_FULL_54_12]
MGQGNMEIFGPEKRDNIRYAVLAASILLAFLSLGYRGYHLENERVRLEGERARLEHERAQLMQDLEWTRQDFASTTGRLLLDIERLDRLFWSTANERDNLEENLRTQQDVIDTMQRDVVSALGDVGVLQKLSTTDRELLAKYSRVYFLNENYAPRALAAIPSYYLNEPEKEQKILLDVLPFLHRLLDDANASSTGVDLRIVSAYRSFGTQSTLKSTYKMVYGSRSANTFSADQGYSEHQLGSTIDFTTTALGAKFESIETTPAYQWLRDNAYRYGFILSYPKSNTYYIFEPWHWRFVGKSLAASLHESGKNFYDLPQREIDTYLVSLFDE